MFTIALLMSDRAPGLLRDLFGDDARRLWNRIDDAGAPSEFGTAAAAQPDVVVHVAIWAAVVSLAVLTLWSWRSIGVLAVLAFGASLVIEFAQGRYTSTRSVQLGDIVGNAAGVALGAITAAAVMGAWTAVARPLARRRSRSDRERVRA